MLSVSALTLFKLQFGPTVNAIGHIGAGSSKDLSLKPVELSVPWHSRQSDASVFSLLSWHIRISTFRGRDQEIKELTAWAESPHWVSIKFVSGEGGVGKSRLAAEFAEALREQDWSAGFVNLKNPLTFTMRKKGTLLVVDYPEENIQAVEELLRDLSFIGEGVRLRVLFLTRQGNDKWDVVIHDSGAADIVEMKPLDLMPLDAQSANEIYNSTLGESAEVFNTVPLPVPLEAMEAWLELAPENGRALFILAAAIRNSIHPSEDVVEYRGRELIEALVSREIDRLRKIAKGRQLKDPLVLARVLAMATIAGQLSVEEVRTYPHLIGFDPDKDVEKDLCESGLISDGSIHAPKPDVLAAGFVVKVFSQKQNSASELVWISLVKEPAESLARIERLSHDAEIVLGIHDHRLSMWLRDAVEGHLDRCKLLEPLLSEPTLPIGLTACAVACNRTLLKHTDQNEERARLLNNLSNRLSDAGDGQGALEAIREGTAIRRRLSQANPARFEPDLAMSLDTHGSILFRLERYSEAAVKFSQGTELIRPYADRFPRSPAARLLASIETNYRIAVEKQSEK